MRKVNLEQGSQEWLNWRRGRITATDAPALMGISPYCTPYQCHQRKLGLIPEQAKNPAMQRGIDDEPIARALFNHRYGFDMSPCIIESENHPFLGASLDGISECGKYLLEVKSNGDHYHNALNSRGIPQIHMFQMQHALLCTDKTAEMCFYESYNNREIIVKEVLPNLQWMLDYLTKAKEFWKGIVFHEPPPLSSKDYKEMDSIEWNEKASEYFNLNSQIKTMEERKDKIKKDLIELSGKESSCGAGIKLLKKLVKGRVDYESIPELASIDLNKYRKPSSESWAIMLEK